MAMADIYGVGVAGDPVMDLDDPRWEEYTRAWTRDRHPVIQEVSQVPTIDKTIVLWDRGRRDEELVPGFGEVVRGMAKRVLPDGQWRASPVGVPTSLLEVVHHFEKTGEMLVLRKAPANFVWCTREDLVAFRAWHDWLHWKYHTEFNLPGELLTGLLHAGDLLTVHGTGRDVQAMIALIMIQVYEQNVYMFGASTRDQTVRVINEREFAIIHFERWYAWAGDLIDHYAMRVRNSEPSRELTLTFCEPVPSTPAEYDSRFGYRV